MLPVGGFHHLHERPKTDAKRLRLKSESQPRPDGLGEELMACPIRPLRPTTRLPVQPRLLDRPRPANRPADAQEVGLAHQPSAPGGTLHLLGARMPPVAPGGGMVGDCVSDGLMA